MPSVCDCFLEISSMYIHSLIKYVDIVNAELIESTLKQTIMCTVLMIFYGSQNIKNVAASNIYWLLRLINVHIKKKYR